MELYRGELKDDWKPKQWLRSRYGITALFWTTDVHLARLYAIHQTKTRGLTHKGYVYMCEINDLWCFQYDYDNRSSYGPDFRNLIYTFRDFRHKAVLIKNVIDFPSRDLMRIEASDIVVVYDFDIIQNLKLVQSEILQT